MMPPYKPMMKKLDKCVCLDEFPEYYTVIARFVKGLPLIVHGSPLHLAYGDAILDK